MDPTAVARALVAIALLAVLPGYVWTRVLLPRTRGIERAVFAVALSVVLIVLATFVGNTVFGIAISGSHAVWWSLALTSAGWAAMAWTKAPARA